MSIYMSTLDVITNSYNTLANATIKNVNQRACLKCTTIIVYTDFL